MLKSLIYYRNYIEPEGVAKNKIDDDNRITKAEEEKQVELTVKIEDEEIVEFQMIMEMTTFIKDTIRTTEAIERNLEKVERCFRRGIELYERVIGCIDVLCKDKTEFFDDRNVAFLIS